MDAEYLTTAEVAALRRMSPASVRRERRSGAGPPWLRTGRRILYPAVELEQWLRSKLVTPEVD